MGSYAMSSLDIAQLYILALNDDFIPIENLQVSLGRPDNGGAVALTATWNSVDASNWSLEDPETPIKVGEDKVMQLSFTFNLVDLLSIFATPESASMSTTSDTRPTELERLKRELAYNAALLASKWQEASEMLDEFDEEE